MSGYNFGLTAHQEALALLAALSDPATYAERIKQDMDNKIAAEKAIAELQAMHDDITDKTARNEAVLSDALKVREDTISYRNEIANRQNNVEHALAEREAAVKAAEVDLAARVQTFEEHSMAMQSNLAAKHGLVDDVKAVLAAKQAIVDGLRADLEDKLAKIKAINS